MRNLQARLRIDFSHTKTARFDRDLGGGLMSKAETAIGVWRHSGQDRMSYLSVDVGQTEVPSSVAVGQLFMMQAK